MQYLTFLSLFVLSIQVIFCKDLNDPILRRVIREDNVVDAKIEKSIEASDIKKRDSSETAVENAVEAVQAILDAENGNGGNNNGQPERPTGAVNGGVVVGPPFGVNGGVVVGPPGGVNGGVVPGHGGGHPGNGNGGSIWGNNNGGSFFSNILQFIFSMFSNQSGGGNNNGFSGILPGIFYILFGNTLSGDGSEYDNYGEDGSGWDYSITESIEYYVYDYGSNENSWGNNGNSWGNNGNSWGNSGGIMSLIYGLLGNSWGNNGNSWGNNGNSWGNSGGITSLIDNLLGYGGFGGSSSYGGGAGGLIYALMSALIECIMDKYNYNPNGINNQQGTLK